MVSVLSQMWDADGMDHGWWWAVGIGWLVFLALLAVLAFVLVRQLGDRRGPRTATPHEVLDERFARGEIDEDEYRRRRDALRG
jgi:putative membrane protein